MKPREKLEKNNNNKLSLRILLLGNYCRSAEINFKTQTSAELATREIYCFNFMQISSMSLQLLSHDKVNSSEVMLAN